MKKQKELSKTETKLKLPCEVEVTLSRAVEVNHWCGQIMHSTLFGGKLMADLARLTNDSEKITKWFYMLKEKLKTDINKKLEAADKLPVSGRALEMRIAEELQPLLDDTTPMPEKLRMPLIRYSQLIADRDYPHMNLKQGDCLVPMGFVKVMMDWLEMDV